MYEDIAPGIKAESLRLASSLDLRRSSAVRTDPAAFNWPPGHNPSRSMVMYDIRCGSSSKDLIVSRVFLSQLHK